MGKSTACSILRGAIKPNLGELDARKQPGWSEIVSYYRGSDLQNYFKALMEDRLKVVVKPQLEAGLFARRFRGISVREFLQQRNERSKMTHYAQELDLAHLMDREIQQLSGGELQRLAIACTLCRSADVYIFDEVSSFLDAKQRLKATELIRGLVHGVDGLKRPNEGGAMASSKKYVIVVEHDLMVLDHVSDYVQCLYGVSGAYGVVTSRARVRNSINQFLTGYIKHDNMRFRDHELTFRATASEPAPDGNADMREGNATIGASIETKLGVHRYPAMTRTPTRLDESGNIMSTFTLNVESGSFRDGECIVLMGENGTGKSTFMAMLAGRAKSQSGAGISSGGKQIDPSLAALGVAYKAQGMNPALRKFKGTVQQLLERDINDALADRMFRLLVMKELNIDKSFGDLPVATLSGGEMQRLSIVLCLGQMSARVYLIDEPSAALDCEQRLVAAKVMKNWVVNHLGRTMFLVEHDFVMAAAMADRAVVYEGSPGVECVASSPVTVKDGFNRFLQNLNVTIRLDPANGRPRINKKSSRIHKLQKASGEYYAFADFGENEAGESEEIVA